jgi:SAM-dependent methyltransferase
MSPYFSRAMKFGIIGALGWVLNLGILWVLTERIGVYYLTSETIAVLLVAFFNYNGNILVGNIPRPRFQFSLPNPLRDRRLWEVRRRLHTFNLDIGAGAYPITRSSVTVDVQASKDPDFCVDVRNVLPWPSSFFDSVTCLELLEHFTTLEQLSVLQEISRVLSPGGQVLIIVPEAGPLQVLQKISWFVRSHTTQKEYHENELCRGHIGMLSPRELESMLRWAGLQVLESRRVMVYDRLVRAAKPSAERLAPSSQTSDHY